MSNLLLQYFIMDNFNFEEEWELCDAGLYEEPYFDLVIGYYRFIQEHEIEQIIVGDIALINGRIVVFYGFELVYHDCARGKG